MGIPFTPETVEAAYRRGIFPMSDPDTGWISWYHPRKRAMIPLDAFHVSRSLARRMRKQDFQVTYDCAFEQVMRACASRDSTWISEEFIDVYGELHRRGKAHSVEVWIDGQLAGGTYGVHLGAAFFAESKFHRVTDMSKVALASLAGKLLGGGFQLLEVQYLTPHLAQFGAIEVPDRTYAGILASALEGRGRW
jgi:leucyl/phenylalanyl-tRNA---protein transferase